MNKVIFTLMLCFCLSATVMAKGQYQTKAQFLNQAFNGQVPKASVLWLSAEDNQAISEIMQRRFKMLRVRYWQRENETIWILDEIGKEKPITIAVHIKGQQILLLKVLAFRESRGDEVRHDFFTRQYNSVQLDNENNLTQHIDGITGATMSVRALTKVARLSLWLNNKVQKP